MLSAGLVALLAAPAAADHRDGPILVNTAVNGKFDIGEMYVFRSPTNANNTVLVMTVSPFPGNLTPAFFATDIRYEIKVDSTLDGIADKTFRATFGPPGGTDVQQVVLRCHPAPRCPNRGLLARGQTGQNIPVAGALSGTFRAGIQDDPFFFDQGSAGGGWDDRVQDGVGTFPRVGAKNFYGPNVNILALVLELRSSRLARNNELIRVWGRTVADGVQQDRAGNPLVNHALIPPVPRNNPARGERRNAFNAGRPLNDVADFKADMVSVLQTFYARTSTDAGAIADLVLPDTLVFQIGNPNGWGTFVSDGTGTPSGTFLGNGRRLRDDTSDIMLNFLSNGAITTDNVPDDNGTKITDGNMGTVAAFPYIGAANLPLNGPGTGPNP
jgi:hypothetical protein